MAKYGSEEYKNIKEAINKEGFVKDEEGEGAVFIGTKEEVKAARERAETEGRAPDLASYIRLNKEIVATKEEIEKLTVEKEEKAFVDREKKRFDSAKIGQVQLVFTNPQTSTFTFLYKDRNGDLAKIKIETQKISDFEDRAAEVKIKRGIQQGGYPTAELALITLNELLTDLNFNVKGDLFGSSNAVLNWIEEKRKEKLNLEKQEGFSF